MNLQPVSKRFLPSCVAQIDTGHFALLPRATGVKLPRDLRNRHTWFWVPVPRDLKWDKQALPNVIRPLSSGTQRPEVST